MTNTTCPGPSTHVFTLHKVYDTGTYAVWTWKCRLCGIDMDVPQERKATDGE